MTDRQFLTESEYSEEVNRQAQYLIEAVEESDYGDDDLLPHTHEVGDVLDGHEWFNGSHRMSHHALIIEYANYDGATAVHGKASVDQSGAAAVLKELAYLQFQEDVISTAPDSHNGY